MQIQFLFCFLFIIASHIKIAFTLGQHVAFTKLNRNTVQLRNSAAVGLGEE